MYNITHFGPTTKGTTVFSSNGATMPAVLVILPEGLIVRSYGTPPIDSDIKNQFGDRDCTHYNIKGNLFAIAGTSLIDASSNIVRTDATDQSKHVVFVPLVRLTPNGAKFMPISFANAYEYTIRDTWFKSGSSTFTRYITHYTCIKRRYILRKIVVETKTGNVIKATLSRDFFWYDPGKLRYKTWSHSTINYQNLSDREAEIFGLTQTAWKPIDASFRVLGESDMSFTIDPSDLIEKFNQTTRRESVPDDNFALGQLTIDAANSAQYLDINTPMYIRDLVGLKNLILSTVTSVSDIYNGEWNQKTLANLYLSFRYGYALTKRDTDKLVQGINRAASNLQWIASLAENQSQIARAASSSEVSRKYGSFMRDIYGTVKYNLKLYYTPYDQTHFKHARDLLQWDLFATAGNLWDFIPYSFVVDWFVPIGNALDAADTHLTLTSLEIQSCVYSILEEYPIPVEMLNLISTRTGFVSGLLTMRVYKRTVSRRPPQPIYRFDAPKSFNRWVEGAALIIQRL